MSSKVIWQLRIAKEVAERVEELSKATGLAKSALVTLALNAMFERDKWQNIAVNAVAK